MPFDCVDHVILLSRLQSRFGLDGAVLAWIRCFLTDRTLHVCFGGHLSAEIRVNLAPTINIQTYLLNCSCHAMVQLLASNAVRKH